jgi:dUTPase
MLEVKIKKLHKDAVIPKYETVGSVGMDLTAVSKEYDEHGNVVFGTGPFVLPQIGRPKTLMYVLFLAWKLIPVRSLCQG